MGKSFNFKYWILNSNKPKIKGNLSLLFQKIYNKYLITFSIDPSVLLVSIYVPSVLNSSTLRFKKA